MNEFPAAAEELLNQALALHQQGRLPEAQVAYEGLLRDFPTHPSALAGLATVHAQTGNFVAALDLHTIALKLHPEQAEIHHQRGVVLRQLCRFEEARDCFDRALELQPDAVETYNNRAIVWKDLGQLDKAVADYDRALALQPEFVNAWKNRAITLRALKRSAEALTSYDQALNIDPQDAQCWNYRGHALRDLGHLEEALASYDEALRQRPEYAEAHYNRSIVLRELLRHEEAIASCDRAIALKPDHADAWWNKAEMLVLIGDAAQGWPLFEWRWRSSMHGKEFRDLGRPLWLGQGDLAGKTLLLSIDGGIGDVLQFCRYAPLLVERGARLILEAQVGLLPLLRESFEQVELTPFRQPLPDFDCYCPVMSLPGAFSQAPVQVPASLPYLRVPAASLAAWEKRLGPRRRPRIGLVWSGGALHFKGQEHRSIPLSQMQPLLTYEADFHCLQKEILPSDRSALSSLSIQTWEAELHDYADTAALLKHMDLVISVDTSVAHLAGALGHPVWVILPQDPDMRWQLEREDSPWYPDVMRLFRQDAPQQWASVLLRVAETLRKFLAERPIS